MSSLNPRQFVIEISHGLGELLGFIVNGRCALFGKGDQLAPFRPLEDFGDGGDWGHRGITILQLQSHWQRKLYS